MKRCPTCNQTFEEDWLAFCTQDGTTLIDDSPPKKDEPPPTILSTAPPPGDWQQQSGGLGSGQFQPQPMAQPMPTPPPSNSPAPFGSGVSASTGWAAPPPFMILAPKQNRGGPDDLRYLFDHHQCAVIQAPCRRYWHGIYQLVQIKEQTGRSRRLLCHRPIATGAVTFWA